MSTLVYYYLPEDRDESEKLNAFIIYKDRDIKINDIKENFPLPGKYYYRFKFKFQEKIVWIDLGNPDANLPMFDGKIIMKVTRISWDEDRMEQNSKQNLMDFPI
jgi:hypothetical protein